MADQKRVLIPPPAIAGGTAMERIHQRWNLLLADKPLLGRIQTLSRQEQETVDVLVHEMTKLAMEANVGRATALAVMVDELVSRVENPTKLDAMATKLAIQNG